MPNDINDEVCYCGLPMKEHKPFGGGGCSTPKVMPRPAAYDPEESANLIEEGRRWECLRLKYAAYTGADASYVFPLADQLEAAGREIERLRTLPCDSVPANDWIMKNAPIEVIESLWAWRRIADKALKVSQTVEALTGAQETPE